MPTKYRITLVLADGRKLFYGTLASIPGKEAIPFAVRDVLVEPVQG